MDVAVMNTLLPQSMNFDKSPGACLKRSHEQPSTSPSKKPCPVNDSGHVTADSGHASGSLQSEDEQVNRFPDCICNNIMLIPDSIKSTFSLKSGMICYLFIDLFAKLDGINADSDMRYIVGITYLNC